MQISFPFKYVFIVKRKSMKWKLIGNVEQDFFMKLKERKKILKKMLIRKKDIFIFLYQNYGNNNSIVKLLIV